MKDLPLITVVMPIRNECGFIERSLGAVLSQSYPLDRFEVLVADGMSTDCTREVIQTLMARHPNLRIINNPAGIVATGLNEALLRARGDIIVRVDGHTVVAPDYLQVCVETLQRTGADNVGGRMDPISERPFGKSVALATSSRFGVGGARFHYSEREEWVDTVYMGAWPRSVFNKIGLFDEELVRDQDDEFNYRLLKSGGKIRLNPLIKSYYYNRSSLRSLWRQYYQYGYWKVRVMQKHSRQIRLRQLVPPLFVLALLVFSVTALFFRPSFLALLSVIGVYLTVNFLASLLVARKAEWRAALFLPLTYATLHLSYGFGVLAGLLKFSHRWGDKSTNSSHGNTMPELAPNVVPTTDRPRSP